MLKFGSINESNQGGVSGSSYRFLYKVKGGENTDWLNTNSTSHNEYKGGTFIARTGQNWSNIETISSMCAECHGDYHASDKITAQTPPVGTPWLRHPTDAVIPNSDEYAYISTTGGYDVITPVGRSASLDSFSSPSADITLDSDVITCLSCHGAHGTSNFKIMRWNYRGWPAAGTNGCNVCHVTKD
jgi:cytochrome c553